MTSALTRAHLEAQARLRRLAMRGVAQAWTALPAYDEQNVPDFLAAVLPLAAASQRQAALLADAYIARILERQPLGIDPDAVAGAAVRAGADPAEVYRRPFVTVWTALGSGTMYEQAVHAGLARAVKTAETDVQLTQRATLAEVQARDSRIGGWTRVANAGACAFCSEIDGAFVKNADAMPLHPGCGCTLEPADPAPETAAPSDVAVHEHGELGPTLADPAHHFTSALDPTAAARTPRLHEGGSRDG